MKCLSLLSCASLAILLAACASMDEDPRTYTAFSPYITKDGKQSFRFVAKNRLPPSYPISMAQLHEQLIGNELGKRQYCMRGYDIVSTTNVDDNIIYEGVCR